MSNRLHGSAHPYIISIIDATTHHEHSRKMGGMMKLRNLLGLFAGTLAMAFAPAAGATVKNTGGATVVGLRVHPGSPSDITTNGAFVRIEVDKDLQCAANVTGSERKRAYVFGNATATGNSNTTPDDMTRIQNLITAAMLSGKKVSISIDDAATTGVFAAGCKLVDIFLEP